MKVKRTNSGTKVNLLISSDAIELGRLKRHVLGHFESSVKVPGFRTGSAPETLIEKNIDQQALTNEFINHAVNEFYQKALDIEKIRAVGQPTVTVKKFVPYTDLEIEIEVEALGPISLPDYKRIKVPKKKAVVTADEVNEVLQTLRERMAERQEVDRPAKLGDEALIDFDGYDKSGKAIPRTSARNHPVVLGSKTLVPGFEDNLVGAKSRSEKDFKIKFPADYGVKTLANQNVDFKVKIHKVSEIVEAAVDDKFAAKAGPFKNLAELKADIKKQLTAEREAQAARDYENEVVKKIVERAKLEVPKSLVEEELTRLEEEEKRNITFRGQTWQEHLAEEKVSEQEHRERQRPVAFERVKGGLVLSEIAENEKIQVTDKEVSQRIELLKEDYKDEQMRAELDKPENRNNIVSRLLTEKTLAKLIGYASK